MATKEIQKYEINGNPLQVESAVRDGNGATIDETYLPLDGSSENARVGNFVADMNREWMNDFLFGTGTVDTAFSGVAELLSLRGHTSWNVTVPNHSNVLKNVSTLFNLYNPTAHRAKVVESDNDNNGLCVAGEGITTSSVIEFSETNDFASITEIALTDEVNSMGIHYLHCSVPSDGYVRVKNLEPEDICISNVWGGSRVHYYEPFHQTEVGVNSVAYFATGMKSVQLGGEDVVYDEMTADRYFERVADYSFGATPSVSYVNATGTYNIYRMSLSNALNKGFCYIGGSSKFIFSDVGQIGTSTPISADVMSLYTNYIYFTIAQSEDTTYTYTEDTAVVDAETFASELSDKGALFIYDDPDYVSVTEYTEGATYYYISATNLHGLNGKAIVDEIANKHVLYQIRSMDKSTYSGSAISPAKEWSYEMSDFGTEDLIPNEGFENSVPYWFVSYPINYREEINMLPDNYMSKESATNMLKQIGNLQGFDFTDISKNPDTGAWQVNGLVDTKETIVRLETVFPLSTGGEGSVQNLHDYRELKKVIDGKFGQYQYIYIPYPFQTWRTLCCRILSRSEDGWIRIYVSMSDKTNKIVSLLHWGTDVVRYVIRNI